MSSLNSFNNGLDSEQLEQNSVKSSLVNTLKSVTVKPFGGVGDWDKVSLTGSCTRVRIAREWSKPIYILIDFWIHQWWDESTSIEMNSRLDFNPKKIDWVILTHAHLDHIGRLPMLVWDDSRSFDWSIFANNVTAALTRISLEDSAKIMEENYNAAQSRITRLRSMLNRQLSELRDLELALDNWFKKKVKKSRIKKISEIRSSSSKSQIEERISEIKTLLEEYWINENSDIADVFSWKLKNLEAKVLYSIEDVYKIYSKIVKTPMYKRKEIFPWVYLRFFDAAHIIGSCQVVLEIDKWDWTTFNMWFSWDVWRFFDPWFLWQPDVPNIPLNYYQIESTYWNRLHSNKKEDRDKLVSKINNLRARWWKVVIPCFMIQRLQDLAMVLIEMMESWEIPKMPIYYDWAYIDRINDIFLNSDNENYKNLASKYLVPVQESETDSNKFLSANWPCILLSPSWMMHWWSVTKYVKPVLSDPNNALFFVWYQAEWTTWRKILEWLKSFDLPWVWYVDIKSQIESFWSFSWHWDQDDLVFLMSELWLRTQSNVFVNHWDKGSSQDALIEALSQNWINSKPFELWKTYKVY